MALLTAALECLNKNSYNEEKCQAQVDALYECCRAFYESNGDRSRTASCPKPDLLRVKLEQRGEKTETK